MIALIYLYVIKLCKNYTRLKFRIIQKTILRHITTNMILRIKSLCVNLCAIHYLLTCPVFSQDNKITSRTSNDTISTKPIFEERFILINGIEQWVTIKGNNSKPVILFLHGGPGSPISPYSDNLYKKWETDFILVQWDQRGTGKTFGLKAPEELSPEYLQSNPLTIDQMVSDGIELSENLIKHLGKQKVILFGTSWGSALGAKMATKRPELFYAYVGHSQIVDPSNDSALYDRVYRLAQKNNDKESLQTLNSIGKPPYGRAKAVGQLLMITKKYERKNSTPPPASWFIESDGYTNPKDNQNRSDGDDYSFVNYVGDDRLGVRSMRSSINLIRDNLVFKIPVYLIQGDEDLLTPKEMTKAYFNKLKAPLKKYILLPKTAHGFNLAVLETQYEIFKTIEAL